jgi:galactose mutarotase-like enzyme
MPSRSGGEDVLLESSVIALACTPRSGARIVSLRDKRNGREWLAQGAKTYRPDESALFGAREAAGWDECFPTVLPCNAEATPWRRRLRDHGDLWGREWSIGRQTESLIETSFEGREFLFRRVIELVGHNVEIRYAVRNLLDEPLPCMWALHALYAVEVGDRILVEPDGGAMTLTSCLVEGKQWTTDAMRWPVAHADKPVDLDVVHPASARMAVKAYLNCGERRAAKIIGKQGGLEVRWDLNNDSLGLWLNYGGWPEPGDLHHIALEPTSSPADDLLAAMDLGRAATLVAQSERAWGVTLSVLSV